MSASPQNCFHLTVEVVLEIHAEAISQFGGSDGIRELALLESAVSAPQASCGGQSPYTDRADIAAAYLFYPSGNHPIIDGHKRPALGACLVLLRLNGLEPSPDNEEWEKLVLDVASSQLDRVQTTKQLRKLISRKR
jgi:death-on-curing protein